VESKSVKKRIATQKGLKSNCCGANVTIGGDDEEGTHYYVCTKCFKACDIRGNK
jgi:hypothetical protein